MLSAGLKPLSYRLRTELAVEAWHWNPRGHWSDEQHHRGYWISSESADKPIPFSNGYSLPRRGSTIDQANNRGYSRLDDGDPNTFWKSNPYLTSHFTHEPDSLHPQWVIMDLGRSVPIDTIRIQWATPFAKRYRVERYTGEDAINLSPGEWKVFPSGNITAGKGGTETLRLSSRPLSVRFVRLLLLESSPSVVSASNSKGDDIRDHLGYAIRELSIGKRDSEGRLHDSIRHGKSRSTQTLMYVSSTDPWHRPEDRDPNVEQPSFERLKASGLTNNLPMMTPVGLLYDTPENAVAEIRYLKSIGMPLTQIELGEEPDGQYVEPEDYGALFIQWSDAIHAVAPELKMGGPGFQTDIHGWHCYPDKSGDYSWIHRFLTYLKRRNHLQDFQFFSFEWYPFDSGTVSPASQLAQHAAILRRSLRGLREDGVPLSIPWVITEYGYSSSAMEAEVDLPGALLNAEIVGEFLAQGGKIAYLYGYEPNTLMREDGGSWGNLTMLLAGENGEIRCPLPCYYGAKLLSQEWAQPGEGEHSLYPTSVKSVGASDAPVSAYTVLRPDGQWALLLLNRSPQRSASVNILFKNGRNPVTTFHGTLDVVQYGPDQYRWKPNGKNGYPARNLAPKTVVLSASKSVVLPGYSLTVVRGRRSDK